MLQKLKELTLHNLSAFFGTPAFLWQLFFFFLPLTVVVLLSILITDGTWSLSAAPFLSLFTPTYARIIIRSLLLGFITACICLLIAYPTAYFLAFKAGRLKNILLFLLILPFWTNFLLHVYAWFFVFEHQGFLNTFLLKVGLIGQPLRILNTMVAVYIMMVYFYLPFMALPIYTLLEKFDYQLIEASSDLGATWSQTLRKVMIPLTLPGILSGFFLVFVPSFAEFAIPELLGGDRFMFVGSVISRFILASNMISYGSAFTLLSSLILALTALGLYFAARKIVKIL